MALRVLLADESSTIKRVIQLALQDYAVDVKSIPMGLDVLPVTKTFKPDVIFADILLPQRTGYDVCQDLKNDPETKNIPVILMWSSFMELDEAKASQCRAEGRLEKPFETEQLRVLVQNLVPKLKSNTVSNFLRFPKLPDFTEETPATENISLKTFTPPPQEEKSFDVFAIPEVSADESFQQVPLRKSPPAIESMQVQLEPEITTEEPSFEEISFETPQPTPVKSAQPPSALDIALTEKIIREETQKMLQAMIWKILPEITERVVKEEINKLLQETEKSI